MKSTPHFLYSVLNSTQEIKKWPDNGSIDCSQQPYVNLLENWEASNRWILWLIKIFYLYYWQAGALDNLLQAFNSYVQKLTKKSFSLKSLHITMFRDKFSFIFTSLKHSVIVYLGGGMLQQETLQFIFNCTHDCNIIKWRSISLLLNVIFL